MDAMGTLHRPAGAGARVISLVPSLTELLLALGLGAQLVGRTRYCVHPAARVDAIPVVGGTKGVRVDRVRALAPTHLVVNVDENTREEVDALRSVVPHVIVTHPRGPADNPGLYRLLGGVFGRSAEAERLCEAFDSAYVRALGRGRALPERRVLYLIWRRPWMTVSADTYIARMLRVVNWHNVSGDDGTRYPTLTLDSEFLSRVDLVLLPGEPYPFGARHQAELQSLAGSTATRILRCDGEQTSWYGNRAIQGLDYLADLAQGLTESAA